MSDVRRPKEFEHMMYDLCQSKESVFSTYKDLMVFAACLGYHEDIKKEFDKSSEPIGMHIFHGEYDLTIFNSLALCATGDPNVMGDGREGERIKLFEEYANGGLEIIKRRVYESPDDWETSLVRLVSEQLTNKGTLLENLAEFI